MHAPTHPLMQPSRTPALPGTWKLVGGRAITLQPLQHGVLKVAHGRLWATFDGPHEGPRNESGDHVVEVGDTLRVAAGQRVVVEAWQREGAAYFTWDPVPAPVSAPALTLADLVQPLHDLQLALGLGVRAAGRVVVVLLRALADATLPRRTVPPRAFNGHCKA